MTTIRLLRAAGLVGICLIVVLSLVPGSYRPETGAGGGLEHFLAYAMTASVLALGWRSPARSLGFIVVLFLLSASLEVAQLFVPGRGAHLATAFVSGFGALCGTLCSAAGLWMIGAPLTKPSQSAAALDLFDGRRRKDVIGHADGPRSRLR